MAKKEVVGRGLDKLLGTVGTTGIIGSEGLLEVDLDSVELSSYQPRTSMDKKALTELANSINQSGVIQPIVVRKKGERYELIAGERRVRAAKLAGLKRIPVIIKEITDVEARKLALVENIQREDLNPLDAAKAIKAIIAEYSLSQDELADSLGISRSALANKLRLLNLPMDAQKALMDGSITEGHARAILALDDIAQRKKLLSAIIEKGLSVREAEDWVKSQKGGIEEKKRGKPRDDAKKFPHQELVEQLQKRLGTRVLARGTEMRGKLEIHYFSLEDLFRIADILLGRK